MQNSDVPNLASSLRFGALDVAAASRLGAGPRLREENQDNLVLIDSGGQAVWLQGQQPQRRQLARWRQGHARLAVLDGMGGHGHGREAAEAVAAGLLAIPPCDSAAELTRRLDALHAELQRHFAAAGRPGPRPGTTLTMLELPEGGDPLLYHVGDSRLYEITRERVAPLSVDHVPATAFAMGGLLGEPEWWQQVHGEHRPQVSQAFILGNAFANPAQLNDPLFELTPLNLPSWLCALPDRRAVRLRAGRHLPAGDRRPVVLLGSLRLGGPMAAAAGRTARCGRHAVGPAARLRGASAGVLLSGQRERDPAAHAGRRRARWCATRPHCRAPDPCSGHVAKNAF
jgi:hypothetical protein